MHQVAHHEEQMALDNPHLNTFYRILALLEFPGHIEELTAHVLQHSPKARRFSRARGDGVLVIALRTLFETQATLSDKRIAFCRTFPTSGELTKALWRSTKL